MLSATAHWSVTADLVPMVPADKYNNLPAIKTINAHPHLFKITTPIIKVNCFEELLFDHPNQPGVKSVCFSLCHGFWPHVHMRHVDYPTMWDNSHRSIRSQVKLDFLEGQMDIEVATG